MSVFLITGSFITTLRIPEDAFEPGGEANGGALAYLAHEYLGSAFGTVHWARAVRPMDRLDPAICRPLGPECPRRCHRAAKFTAGSCGRG